ncbi:MULTISPECIES: hypothetical protein [Streptomyces]|uniref:Alpha/beta hydrolase family protein n=3 Tax=Streptomyces scabiei TaxID=1930 RepID=C9YUE1_STRSW|nr:MULTISPECIES: hypothetical protein [Streptomyces]MBP5934566.1 hypothetical protein [Streptomyces sp. LBUM 1479]KFG08525.1 hypothetical protein IQ61_13130 [Streptomyces scabiei]MBP5880406.1 hypothetical protein [Streptomyces sp. LBUM 1477]MBP5888240.1 hypothetical protein [Streptomyces sp. LBUM 1487]MBP5889177.1 hypothetical protein [Streptomyces sp. LBUM 1481]
MTSVLKAAPAWEAVRVATAGGPLGETLVGVVDGRGDAGGPTFLVAQGFLAFVEPFEMQRFRLIASILRARLVVVETPGAGFAASRLLPAERRALLRGDFTVPARRMLRAATEVLGADGRGAGAGETDVSGVLGYSLGASFAAAMAAVSGTTRTGPPLRTVVLVEPVAVRRWSAVGLLAAVHHENRLIRPYLDQTATVPGAVRPLEDRTDAEPVTRRRGDLLLLANALRAARLGGDLMTAGRRDPGPERSRLLVVRGERSTLSPREAVASLMASAERHGYAAHLLSVPGPHAFWHSLPAVAAATTRLGRILGTTTP